MKDILKTALSLKSSTCLRFPNAYRQGQQGQLLIMLIITMVIMSVLSAAMVYIFSSSTLNTAFANYSQRAYYSAEAGARYAMAIYRSKGKDSFMALNGTPVVFPNNNGKAILTIVDSMNNATTVPTATPASAVTVPVGGNLSITVDATQIIHFPTINGFFRINGTTLLRYKSRLANQLQVVTGQAVSGITVLSTDTITVPLGQVAITAKGFYPVAGILNMSRTVSYGWILSGYGGGNDVQNPQNPDLAANDASGVALGKWNQDTPNYKIDGGGGALQPTKTSGIATSFLPTTETAYLQAAWYNQGGFLSYLGQVKVATGTLQNIGGIYDYTLTIPQPVYYGGGLTFRDQGKDNPGQWRGYGLVFYRGPIAGVVTPTPSLEDKSLVYLTVRNSNGDLRPVAYAQILTTDLALEQIPNAWVSVSGAHYEVGNKVSSLGSYYACKLQNTAAAGNQPGSVGGQAYWATFTFSAGLYLANWSTIAVDVTEAASITLNSDPGFVIGKSVSKGGATMGVVIDKIYDNGSTVLLLNGSNGVGVGTFAVNDIVVQGTISTTVSAWRPRDNYIRAYYGDKNSTQTGNLTSLDPNRRKYVRLNNPIGADFNWPTKNPTADNNIITGDLFTIVQWTKPANSEDGYIMQDMLIDENGGTPKLNTIIRSNLLITSTYASLVPPELGILAFGYATADSNTFFDNFAYKLKGIATGGVIIPPIQQ